MRPFILLFATVCLIVGCASAPTLSGTLYDAELTAIAADRTVTALYASGKISPAQATRIINMAHVVDATVKLATALANKGDAAGAAAQLAAVAADIQALKVAP